MHGYDDDATLWQVLPQSVRLAAWIVAAIIGLALIGANVPFAPPVPAEPPDERDSSAFVNAMAALLRRAHAAGALPPRLQRTRCAARKAARFHRTSAMRLPNSSACASPPRRRTQRCCAPLLWIFACERTFHDRCRERVGRAHLRGHESCGRGCRPIHARTHDRAARRAATR